MGYFQVRYESRVVNYDRRGFIRLATELQLHHWVNAAFKWCHWLIFIEWANYWEWLYYPGNFWSNLTISWNFLSVSWLSTLNKFLIQNINNGGTLISWGGGYSSLVRVPSGLLKQVLLKVNISKKFWYKMKLVLCLHLLKHSNFKSF